MTAPRLDALLDDMLPRADGARLRELVQLLSSIPSPWGHERRAAEAVADWIAKTAVAVRGGVDGLSDERANVVLDAGDGPRRLVLCSHLDTSLSGLPSRDEPLTGRGDAPAGLDGDGDLLIGPGLAVARGPAAAATIGYLAAVAALERAGQAHRSSLLLAAGGTHHRHTATERSDPPAEFGMGVRHALARGLAPDAVVIAKAGPPAILHEEPGSAYVDVVLRGRLLPAMSRSDDDGGMLSHLSTVLDAFERWRAAFVARPAAGQVGREAAVGAVIAGSPEKCDMLPAVARLSAYLVLGHGDDATVLAAELERAIGSALPSNGAVGVSVNAGPWVRAGHTPPEAPVVRAASAATGLDAAVERWRGSTDGAVFRAAGIDTVRWGPTITADADDPRLDRVELADLVAAARSYGEIVVRYAIGASSASPAG
jgi:acetylornithine deacetylase/succinyl-diaminopimelate desuccinylase-like protein